MTLGRNHYRHVYTYVYIYIYVNVYMHMYIYIYSIYQWFLNSFCIDWSNLLQIVSEFSEMWLFPEAAFIISVPPSNIWALMQGSTTLQSQIGSNSPLKKTWKTYQNKPCCSGIDGSCNKQYLHISSTFLVDSCCCMWYFFRPDSASRKTSNPSPQGPLAVWLCASKKSWQDSINEDGSRPWMMAMTTSRHGFPRFAVFP